MAGRGRGLTLPAWMTNGGGGEAFAPEVDHSTSSFALPEPSSAANRFHDSRSAPAFDPNPRFDERDIRNIRGPPRGEESGGGGGRGRERERRRSRSRSRSKSGDRRRTARDEVVWKPRGKNKASNFDVRPPDGIELPPIGVNNLVNGVPNSYLSFANYAPLQTSSEAIEGIPALTRIDNSIHTKHARRIYAGGVPPRATEPEIMAFFNDVVTRLLAPQKTNGPPCIKVYLNVEKCYAFVEFMSIELATACMALDGIRFEHYTGTTVLRIRRPNDYHPDQLPASGEIPQFNQQLLEALGATVSGSGKLFVGGLPYHLTDEQVMELLSVFGPLKSFHQVREPGSNTSKGYAFAEYANAEVTDAAIKGLNGMSLGDKTLTVRYAVHSSNTPSSSTAHTIPSQPFSSMQPGSMPMGMHNMQQLQSMGMSMSMPMQSNAMQGMAVVNNVQGMPSRVLKLCNMLTKEDLYNESEFLDIQEDVRLECSDYGQVLSLLLPRMIDGYPASSEGYIYVEFADVAMARNAAMALAGRKFADKIVVVQYYDENQYAARILC